MITEPRVSGLSRYLRGHGWLAGHGLAKSGTCLVLGLLWLSVMPAGQAAEMDWRSMPGGGQARVEGGRLLVELPGEAETAGLRSTQIFVTSNAEEGGDAGTRRWTEHILNSDGTINWTNYRAVGENAGELAARDYLLGPKHAFYHPKKESIPTLELAGDENGLDRPPDVNMTVTQMLKAGWGPRTGISEWYTQAGPLIYVPDNPKDGGVKQVAVGEFWRTASGRPVYWHKVHRDPIKEGWYVFADPPHLRMWNSPGRATAVAIQNGLRTINMYVAFDKGLIGTFVQVASRRFPSVQLPAGKTPMALAVTPGGEFVLAVVWDWIQRKGQVAVIAVQGPVLTSSKVWGGGTCLYGFPVWGAMKDLKLLGFVDLPIAAPTAIAVGHNLQWIGTGRDEPEHNKDIDKLLNNQSERDIWYKGGPAVFDGNSRRAPAGYYKRTASAGYAVVASRAENKVVFIDLQPLFSYYREMYFTTQERYDQTKNMGAAANQWPYSFDHSPKQTPVVACTLSVQAPTAVAAGLSPGMAEKRHYFHDKCWRRSPFDDQHAYVTTMDGRLLVYAVGGLNTESAATQPVPVKAIPIGKNPTSIDTGAGGKPHNDMAIACRGDNAVYCLTSAGDIQHILRDSRIVDAVMAERSSLDRMPDIRRQIHVVDFAGKTVLTYVHTIKHRGIGVDGEDFSEPMRFGARSDPIPGCPFAFQQDEVP